MRNYVRQIIKGGRCNAFSQHYNSEISEEVFKIISKELNINADKCEIFELLCIYDKHYATEFKSKHDDYRDIDQNGRAD